MNSLQHDLFMACPLYDVTPLWHDLLMM